MTRYDELVSLYFDGEPSEAELEELSEILKTDATKAADFQQELFIWEAWSQERAPERSADAFLAGFHTRLRAEEDAPDFELSVTKQLKEQKNPFVWQPLMAIAAVLVILLSLSVFFNPADISTGLVATAKANHVQIQGECVCLRCTLKTEERCKLAIRYQNEKGEVQLIRLKRNPELRKYVKCFCHGPTAASIEGEIIEENGVRMLLASTLKVEDEKVL